MINTIDTGEGIPIVFQHGLGADMNQISSLFSDVSDIRLCGIDCPGHGQSDGSDFYGYSFNQYTDEVLHMIEMKQLAPVILGGLSMGAGIALHMALRYPDKVKALILLRPAWLSSPDPENLLILNEAMSHKSYEDGQERFMTTESYRQLNDLLPAAAQSVLGVLSDHQQHVLKKVIQDMVSDSPFSSIEDLSSIGVHTLIIANDDDPLHPYDISKKIHEGLGNSTLIKVISKYVDPVMHKSQVKDHILAFIKSIS